MYKRLSYIFLILLLILFTFCKKKAEDTSTNPIDNAILPDHTIEKFELIETYKGEEVWRLKAEIANIFDNKKLIEAETLTVNFYEKGKHFSTLTSNKGNINQKTNDMEAMGNVIVKNEEGYTLETEQLKWNNKERKIYSDVFVKITKGRDVLTGIGLETDPNLECIEIKKNLEVSVKDVDELADEVKPNKTEEDTIN